MALIDRFVKLAEIDDRRLALEKKLANAPRPAKEAEARAKDAKDAVQRYKEDGKRAQLELKRLEADAQAMSMYREALERHGDRALASVQGATCQGCFITIRPQQLSMLKSREQL